MKFRGRPRKEEVKENDAEDWQPLFNEENKEPEKGKEKSEMKIKKNEKKKEEEVDVKDLIVKKTKKEREIKKIESRKEVKGFSRFSVLFN